MEIAVTISNCHIAEAHGLTRVAAARLRKASLFDLPYIYYLLIDGAVDGAFAARLLTGRGNVQLFIILLMNLLPFGKLLGKLKIYEFLMFGNEQVDVGFIGISTVESRSNVIIQFFAIGHEHRKQGNGYLMLNRYIESLPANAKIAAYVTKYAVGMQHILAQTGFRQPGNVRGCELKLYLYTKTNHTK